MYKPTIISELKSYTGPKATADLFAGLTVGVVALPLAMAFAIACDLPPERGIYTSIVAGFLISLLGGSKVQIGGPTGAFVILVSQVVLSYGYSGLAICTFAAGFLLVAMGFCKFGSLIKYIPFPVTTGFTSGIAIIIFSTQVKDLFGLKIETVPSGFIDKWSVLISHAGTAGFQATAIGIGTIIFIFGLRKINHRLPAMLFAMLISAAVAKLFHFDIETIGSKFGDLPRSLPPFQLPDFSTENMAPLLRLSFSIAMLGAIESLLSATVADGMTGTRHDSNTELVGQGVANIASSLFGGIPATGAIARTATNIKSGGKTPISGLIHAVTLLLLLLLLAPLAKLIPLACLAGILVVVSYNMSEREHFCAILKGPRSDAFVLVTSLGLTVLVDLTVAIEVGVVLAALLFIRRMSEISETGIITEAIRNTPRTDIEDPNSISLRQVPDHVEVFEVSGPFFFGMIDTFQNAIRDLEDLPVVLIIRLRNVPAVDATGIHNLREFIRHCHRDKTRIILSGVQKQPQEAFEKSGLTELIGEENITDSIDDALKIAETHIIKQTAS